MSPVSNNNLLKKLSQDTYARLLLERSDRYLERLGYTEHGERHAKVVSRFAGQLMRELDHPSELVMCAEVAGYFHDAGNFLGRNNHPQAGALLVKDLLDKHNVKEMQKLLILQAISNHENEELEVADEVSASVIIADKSDVHRSRVRTTEFINFDIHDRVNYAVTRSFIEVDKKNREIILHLEIDTDISSVTEYFEIFLKRMLFSRRAARVLRCSFGIIANGVRLT